ncbi:MAG: phytanoyl-CoA dioxygenase family protein [Polyangiaceae bacterium]
MAQIAQATLGPEAYLFHEQWVVKGAEQGMKFSWHQDSGYVKRYHPATDHRPYVSCWCALDDVNEANGTVYLLPYSRGRTREHILEHQYDAAANDLVAYFGDDPGDPVRVPAGSIVVFTSYLLHRSGPNTTERMRRVYLAQYSNAPITHPDGKPWSMAVPFLKGGEMIYEHAVDSAANWGPFLRSETS